MNRRLFILANLLVITVVAWAVVDTAYKLAAARLMLPPRAEVPRVAGQAEPVARDFLEPESAYAVIVERDLFKTKVEAPPPEPEPELTDLAEAEETTLRIRLLGTVSGDEEYAYAVIEDQVKRSQDLYQVGAAVQDAVVEEIEPRVVYLRRNGKLERLSMDEDKAKGKPGAAPQQQAQAGPGLTRQISLSRALVDSSMQNLNQLMTQARVRPHFEGGQPDGLAITRIRRGSLFTRLGLQDNDVITGVGERDIRTVDDALTIYQNLRNADSLSLRIKRNGVPQTLEYTIQ